MVAVAQADQTFSNRKPRTIRAPHGKDRPYFAMRRETAQDKQLSWEARGMIAYILSKPDDWKIKIADLEQNCSSSRVYRILKELMDAGYVTREAIRDRTGKIKEWTYQTGELPLVENQEVDKPVVEKPLLENQLLDKPLSGFRDPYIIENPQSTDSSQNKDFSLASKTEPAITELQKSFDSLSESSSSNSQEGTEKPIDADFPSLPDGLRWYMVAGDNDLLHAAKPTQTGKFIKPICGHPGIQAVPANRNAIGKRQPCLQCQRTAHAPKVSPDRAHDLVFDAIALGSFNMVKVPSGNGGRIGKLVKQVKECVPDERRATLADDLVLMYARYKKLHPGWETPSTAETICKYLGELWATRQPTTPNGNKPRKHAPECKCKGLGYLTVFAANGQPGSIDCTGEDVIYVS